MKINHRFLWLILLVIAGAFVNYSCERPVVEPNDELVITEVPIDGPFCIEQLKEDVLYRIHDQNDMDTIFEGYKYPLPQLDFSNQSMFLVWGYSYGEVCNKEISFIKVNDDEYRLGIDITEAQILPSGGPWVAAFYTNKIIDKTDSVFVTINIHE